MFTLSNIFNFYPNYADQFIMGELIFFIVLLFAYFYVKLIFKSKIKQSNTYKKLINKITNLLITCAITGFVLIFFQWQGIPYLSAMFLIIILYIVILIWSIHIVIYYKKDFLPSVKKEKEENNYKKYLP